ESPDEFWKGVRPCSFRGCRVRDVDERQRLAGRNVGEAAANLDEIGRPSDRTDGRQADGLSGGDGTMSQNGSDAAQEPRARHHRDALAMRYSFELVRMNRLPLAIAGVASTMPSSAFFQSSLNSEPACITNVSPSSLSAKIFWLYAHGDAVN